METTKKSMKPMLTNMKKFEEESWKLARNYPTGAVMEMEIRDKIVSQKTN